MMTTLRQLGKAFLLIWFGQLVSLIGTSMMRFAFILWAYEKDGKATTLALLGVTGFLPEILLSPFAGVIIDRYDRRLVILIADLCAGVMIGILLVLHLAGNLQIWHLYIAEALIGVFDAFHVPAFSAATTMLVPEGQYVRANGLRSFALYTSQFCAPLLAGTMLALIGLTGVMLADILSYVIAVATLVVVVIPHPEQVHHQAGNFWQKVSFGFRYIYRDRGLTLLLLYFLFVNLAAYLTWFTILPPMVLARTQSNELALAALQTAMGAGGIIGGIAISIWGGPKRPIHGVLLMTAVSFLLGDLVIATGRSLPVWMIGGFLGSFFIPFIVSSDRSIWQKRVAPDIQGRVFSAKSAVQTLSAPIGMLCGGLLADHLFEPMMQSNGILIPFFRSLVGTGHGSGMALMFVCTALSGAIMGFGGYLIPSLRTVDQGLAASPTSSTAQAITADPLVTD